MWRHGLIYTGDEYHFRLGVDLANSRQVRSFNSGEHSFSLGITSLATLTPTEYLLRLGARPYSGGPLRHGPQLPAREPNECPDALDWRNSSVVSPVKDEVA